MDMSCMCIDKYTKVGAGMLIGAYTDMNIDIFAVRSVQSDHAYIDMVYTVMAYNRPYIAMAYIVMAYIGMAYRYGLYSDGL